jgi:hypothetical protein
LGKQTQQRVGDGRTLLSPLVFGNIAGGGKNTLDLAGRIPVHGGVVQDVDRATGGVADRQRVVADEPFGQDLLVTGPRLVGLGKVV